MTNTAIKNLLSEIISDNQSRAIEAITPRSLQIPEIANKAIVIIGVRRAGKTSYLHYLQNQLINKGVDPENIVEINFFDERLHQMDGSSLALITEAYFERYSEKKGEEKVYFFFDEIQEIAGWESFIDRIRRDELSQIFITGSSAKMLSKEIATQMGGRSLSFELFPFSFAEYLTHKKIPIKYNTSKERLKLQSEFQSYFLEGGFPEVIGIDKSVRIKIHQEYYNAIVQRDIVLRHNVKPPQAVNDLAYRLISSNASLYSINRLYDYLRSQQHKLSKEFVANSIGWFEDSYFLFSVFIDDPSLSRRRANARKIYCVDQSLVASMLPPFQHDKGHLLENMIFIALRRKGIQPAYYRTKQENEVDFTFKNEKGDKELLQVALNLEAKETKKREIKALFEALSEQKIKEGTLITLDDDDKITQDGRTIRVVSAWRYLLELS